ncbi:MAG: hypothetical protein OS130_15235 [Thermodesulfobacteriota bacterium]|jgi:membrane protein implicated in regulation of membrane protease activity|nr:MAG: hypothetical protein OS130_15235 [Thermodesulfobacteriota bacterium]
MHIISLFELLLVVLAFYAVVEFEGTMRLAVVLLCLLAVFLVERFDKRIQEDEEVRIRLQRYKILGRKKKVQTEEAKQQTHQVVEGAIKKYNPENRRGNPVAKEAGKTTKSSPLA